MTKETIEVQVRLPKALSEELRAVAKLAGLSVETVVKLSMAVEVRRWQREARPPRDATLTA